MQKLFLILVVCLCGLAVSGQDILTRLEGEWHGTGKVNGMDSTLTMKWERALGGRFTRLTFANDMTSPHGIRKFEGSAMYQESKSGAITATWFDSRGAKFAITATATEDLLVSDWGAEGVEQGRTVYKLTGADTMEVVDSVKGKDGNYKEFGRSEFKRAPGLVQKVREFMDVFNAGDLEKMMTFVTSDIEWLSVAGQKVNIEAAGQDALRKSLEGYFKGTEIGKSTMETAFRSGNYVTVRERVRWIAKDGTDKTQVSIAVYEFAGEKIKRVWYYPATP